MIAEQDNNAVPPRTTSLYDPISGFIYSFELFEKDLFRASVSGHNVGVQRKTLLTKPAGPSNRNSHL